VSNSQQQPRVPDSVLDDLKENPDLMSTWVNDPAFREGILTAEDPKDFAAQDPYNFTLHQETSDWIKERVRARGLETLLDVELHPIAF
jgi:hypothetical protein